MTHDELLRLIDQAADEGWTALDLSNKGLTELPPEIGKLTLLTSLGLGGNQLVTLPKEIGNLINLKDLDLSDNLLAQLPVEIGKLNKIVICDLGFNSLTSLPKEIGNLINLRELNLLHNQLIILPAEIGDLVNLLRFHVGQNKLKSLPHEIGKLKNLTDLILVTNQISKLPFEIVRLKKLVNVNLKNNPLPVPYELLKLTSEPFKIFDFYFQNQKNLDELIVNDIKIKKYNLTCSSEDLRQIIEHASEEELYSLDLSETKLSTLPPEIANLVNIKELHLSHNTLTELPGEIGKLSNLIKLNLDFNQLSKLPSEIKNFKKLTTIGLAHNQLTILPREIGDLKELRILGISHNQLSAIPDEIEYLSNLESLYVSYNKFTIFPENITKLRNLKILDLRGNQLAELPSKIVTLTNLKRLYLRGNPLPIPPEILVLADQPPKILNYYFQHVEKPKKPINEAKVLIVGQGAVGKTSLIKRLLEDEFNPYETKTDGIAIKQWHVNLDNTDIRLNLWDFGGQEIMHATHQFFLTKRSLYLLVLDSRLDEQENRVEYWLKMIQSFGGDSPILVVCNKCDEHDLELNWKGLQDKYPTIRAFARQVSCKTGAGITDLRCLIEQEAGQLPHIHDALILSWFAVKTALEQMPDDYISYGQYRQICAEQEVDDELSQQTLLGFLHDLGIVLHFHDHPMLEDTNVLNPEWVTRGVYQLLNSNELFQSKGELERSTLDRILDPQSYPRAKHQFILDMMRKFELCFDFAEYAGERFLVPDLLSKEEPYTGDWEDSLGFQYHYDILPGSVMSRFIVRMHAYIFKKTYWRHGVVLISTDGKNKALVKADLEERKIFIHIAGRESTRHVFLEIIRADLHKIHKTIPKLKVKEKVLVPGHPEIVVDYEHLLTLEELGEEFFIPEGLKIKVSVRQLLHGIQPGLDIDVQSQSASGLKPAEENIQDASASLRFESGVLTPGKHTYFLSYSWKNSSEADHLELVLNRSQRVVLRDETNIEAGGKVSTSIEQMIQQADTFVALWNEHYTESTWCPNELEYARNRQAKGQKPARIVLIALDDTDVPIRFIDTLRLNGQDRAQRELAVQRLIREE